VAKVIKFPASRIVRRPRRRRPVRVQRSLLVEGLALFGLGVMVGVAAAAGVDLPAALPKREDKRSTDGTVAP
jgi:hypothetical protein